MHFSDHLSTGTGLAINFYLVKSIKKYIKIATRTIMERWSIVTRNHIVLKLVCGYCLCYCKTFSRVPDSTECTKLVFTKECSTLFLLQVVL